MIDIDIVSDPVCPWCFIGKRRLERALADRGEEFAVHWRPFQLNPEMPASGMPRESYLALKFGGPDRARKIYDSVSRAGESEEIAFNFDAIQVQPNTFDAHRLIRWSGSAGVQDKVVEALFTRYFFEGRNIGEHAELLDVAETSGMDRDLVADLLARDADRQLVESEEHQARQLGISGVPCFIVAGRYAVSGAQDPSVLANVFDLAQQEAA